MRDLVVERKIPRLFWIEAEYRWRLEEAELDWVRRLAAEIREGTLDGVAQWRDWHKLGGDIAAVVPLDAAAPRRGGSS